MSAAMPSFRNSNTIFCNLSTFWAYAAVSLAIGPPATPFYAIVVAGLNEVPANYPIRYPGKTETNFSLDRWKPSGLTISVWKGIGRNEAEEQVEVRWRDDWRKLYR